jgi:hydrogenase maturation factor
LIVFLAVTNLHARQQEDYSSGAIKTRYGFLLVWNAPNNHYTLEIRGKNVRQIATKHVQFSVDGMFLQILTSPTKDFIEDAKRQKLNDRAILEAHRDWEVKFMESDYKEKLKVESSWQKLSNGKDTLVWQIDVPESARSNVKKQVSLTLIKGDYVLMLGGVVTDRIEERASRELLLNTIETLKVSDKPINLLKLQESIRKEASNGGAG